MLRLSSRRVQIRRLVSLSLSLLLYLCMLPTIPSAPARARSVAPKESAHSLDQSPQQPNIPIIPAGSAYRQTNFVSDLPGLAFIQDPILVNPWGIAFRGTSPFWVANNGTSTSTLYRGDVGGSPLVKNSGLSVVTIPGGLPTGVVGNATTDFAVTPCAVASCPAAFIFSSITGNIVGWNPSAGPNSTTGVIAASHPGRVYTGLAIGSNSGGNRLYAADFANGNIDVYDGTYALTTTTGGFADATIPTTVGNTFHPFNIQNIGGSLYVMYAKVGSDGEAEAGGVNGGDPGTMYFTAGIGEEEHGLFGSLKPTTALATSLIQFATDDFTISEGSGHIDITVTRAGDASGTATVNFNTFDESQPDHASLKSDYEIALGKLTFNPGETSKTFRILIVNDIFDENDETVDLALSNPTGAGVGLGSPNTAELTITDNDTGAPTTNPIDGSFFFVRQHYLDFLNREPDAAGLVFWATQIESCGADAACRDLRRINVSAAFFLSIEFQRTGLEAYLTHRAAFGLLPGSGPPVPVLYGTFERDTQALQKDFVVGAPGADAVLEANTVAFFNDFVTRPEFVTKYPSTMTNEQYVDALLASAGLDPTNQRLFVTTLTNAAENPPAVPTTTTGAARPASFGTAKFLFNTAQPAMTFTATINNIDVTFTQTSDTNDNLTAAHIHASATVTPTTNAPVVWGFFGQPFNDNNPNDQVFGPLPSGVGGNFFGKWDAPEGNGTTLAAQLSNLRTGHAYINFHTVQFGGGEIRGNFPAETAFRDKLVAGLNGGTESRATILRKVAEAEELKLREFNRAFVFMEYAGYLRRDPDVSGFNFWLNKLNSFNGNFVDAEMVKSFILSGEYRQRFGI